MFCTGKSYQLVSVFYSESVPLDMDDTYKEYYQETHKQTKTSFCLCVLQSCAGLKIWTCMCEQNCIHVRLLETETLKNNKKTYGVIDKKIM